MVRETKTALPGDKVASIEEFESADGTYESNGIIRSSRIGRTVFDLKKRVVKIGGAPKATRVPVAEDYVVGFIDMLPSSMVSMKILYINDVRSYAGFGAIQVNQGRGRRKNMFRVGDMVRAKVVSLLNGNIHVTFRDHDLGVVYALCHSCGGGVVRVDGGSVKCIECGIRDERKLAEGYGKIADGLQHHQG